MTGIDTAKMGMYDDKFRLFGLGSNFDTKSIIDMQLQMLQMKNTPYQNQIDYYNTESKVWNDLKLTVSSFEQSVFSLRTANVLGKQTTLSQEGFATVAADTKAIAGTYKLEIQSLATNHKLMSNQIQNSTLPLGYETTVKINGTELKITSNMTLNDIANAINKGSYKASAVNIDGHLVLTSKVEGSNGKILFEDGMYNQVTTTDKDYATGNITGNLTDGSKSYSLEIQQLATRQEAMATKSIDRSQALGYQGALVVNGKTINVSNSDTLETLAQKINESTDLPIYATIDTAGKMKFISRQTGAASSFTITDNTTKTNDTSSLLKNLGMVDATTGTLNVTAQAKDANYTIDGTSYTSAENVAKNVAGLSINLNKVTTTPVTINVSVGEGKFFETIGMVNSDGTNKNEIEGPQDAKFVLDGISLTSSSNRVRNIVPGLELQLTKNTTEPIKITVYEDKKQIQDKVVAFVEEYNKTMTKLNGLTAKEAILQGESIPRNLKNQMTQSLMKKTNTNVMLYDLGITLDGTAKDGTILLDQNKLSTALAEKPSEVVEMLTGTNGFAKSLYDQLRVFTSENGSLKTKLDGIDRTVKTLNGTIDKNNDLYDKQKDSLLRKYAMFETMMAQLNSQEQYMTASIKAMQPQGDN